MHIVIPLIIGLYGVIAYIIGLHEGQREARRKNNILIAILEAQRNDNKRIL